MSQTIDLAAAVSATFNGSDLSEIKLNSASCWTKPGGGYSLYTLVPGAPLNRTCLASDYTLGTYAGGTTITETLSLANAALVNRGFFYLDSKGSSTYPTTARVIRKRSDGVLSINVQNSPDTTSRRVQAGTTATLNYTSALKSPSSSAFGSKTSHTYDSVELFDNPGTSGTAVGTISYQFGTANGDVLQIYGNHSGQYGQFSSATCTPGYASDTKLYDTTPTISEVIWYEIGTDKSLTLKTNESWGVWSYQQVNYDPYGNVTGSTPWFFKLEGIYNGKYYHHQMSYDEAIAAGGTIANAAQFLSSVQPNYQQPLIDSEGEVSIGTYNHAGTLQSSTKMQELSPTGELLMGLGEA